MWDLDALEVWKQVEWSDNDDNNSDANGIYRRPDFDVDVELFDWKNNVRRQIECKDPTLLVLGIGRRVPHLYLPPDDDW